MNKNFLSKKSWHTGSLKNIENVWKAEQRAADEARKIEQIKRELAEQEQILDLRKRLAESQGRRMDRLDWMYEGSLRRDPTVDDYLLGKKVAPSVEKDDLKELNNRPGALWIESSATNSALDSMAKVMDDPLLRIKQKEQEALKKVLTNPVKMKQVKKEKEMKDLMKTVEKAQER